MLKKMRFKITNYIPPIIKAVLKPIYWFIMDIYDTIKGRSKHLPRRSMIFVGDGDFIKTGEEFFNYFKEIGGLKSNDKVLDIGCGIGRMSLPLTKYLFQGGEYYGFDIVKKGIDWCNNNISTSYPNFHFEHVDIYNKMYNPNGTIQSSEFKFPYDNEKFDFAFLTSVFTHMFRKDIEQYMKEISRVLKKGGRCLVTFFLINDISRALIKKGVSTKEFIYQIDENSFSIDEKIPESAFSFNEKYIMELFKSNSLSIQEPIYYGSWCGRKKFKSYQDIILAEKT